MDNMGLSTYSYPRLTGLPHYGDWQADFESGALAYYEKYSDGTYGFFGGNVDSLSETAPPSVPAAPSWTTATAWSTAPSPQTPSPSPIPWAV